MMTAQMKSTHSRPLAPGRTPQWATGAHLTGALLATGILCSGGAARAELYTGLNTAFTMNAILGTGALISVIGNGVTLAQNKPSRGWMYAGFVLGAINTVMSPIIIIYGRGDIGPVDGMHGPERPDIGFGLGAAHGILGATSLALSIRNAVIWHRQRLTESPLAQPVTLRSTMLANLSVAPLATRDARGGSLYGVVAAGRF